MQKNIDPRLEHRLVVHASVVWLRLGLGLMAINAGMILCHSQTIIALPLMLAALFILLLETCFAFRQCDCGGNQPTRSQVLKMFRLPALLMALSFVGAAFDLGIPRFIYVGMTQLLAGLVLAVSSTRLKSETHSRQ